MAHSNDTLVFIVKRNEPELVVPQSSTPHEIKQLSDIDDQQAFRFVVPVMFFYPPVHGKNIEPVKAIREGLAKALVFYYPLAGRISEGHNRKLMVHCNEEGVLFVEADANVKLEELGDGILPPCPYMEQLLCKIQPDADSGSNVIGCPILSFQVTRFTCGGFSLGIQFNHTMLDGNGVMLFLNAIGNLMKNKSASAPSILPVWEREILTARSPPRITCTHDEYEVSFNNESPINNPIEQDMLIITPVFFGAKEIQSLRNHVRDQIPSPSRFDLMTACLIICRTLALEPNPSENIRVSVAMNARHRKHVNLPIDAYYGNAVVFPAAVSAAKAVSERGLDYAVDMVRRAKNQLSEEYIRSVADLMVKNGRPNHVAKWNYFVSDLTKLGYDELDLGWGKPLYGGIPWATPVISWFTSFKNAKGEEGAVLTTSLPFSALEKFHYEVKKMVG